MSQTTPDYRTLMSKALLEIKDLKARLQRHEDERAEPIAIIGMACRFPGGANSPDSYWDLLREGVDAIGEVPAERWDIDSLYDADRGVPGKIATRFGGFIDDVGSFDAGFFGISPREAESLDPHQRILLEVCWEALEHANLVPESLYGSNAGVFIGVSSMDQVINQMGTAPLEGIGPYHGTGCAMAPIAGRISYNFGFNGPSFVVDTACSSSLLSLHLAAESLRRRECNMALGGGVHLLFHPGYSVAFSKAGMLSADGRCKTFDAAADGYVRGEGCGVVVLKRLSDAQRDGDPILALLRGSAVNQDGASGGLTVPSGPSQEQVVKQALARSGIDAARVSYVEAHGTGTPLGDPIELGALANVFKQPLLVGSVKSNIGHLEASAGIASTIKVILALQHKTIPPHLHLRNPNPMIPWQDLSITVPTRLTPWTQADGQERVAGISAFGFSGTNVHLLLSEAPGVATPGVATPAKPENTPQLLLLSARTEEALRAQAARWAAGPLADPALDFAVVCANATRYRSAFAHRLALVAGDAAEARGALEEFSAKGNAAGVVAAVAGAGKAVAFLFTGQGSQYVGMGRDLYQSSAVFRAAVDECAALLQTELDLPLTSLLYPDTPDEQAKSAALLDTTRYTQPALFVVEYALARLWQSYGVKPAAVLGHSVGEYVAACLAGVFILADALRLIAARGRLMQALPAGGAMAAVLADPVLVEAAVAGHGEALSIAAYNGPRNTVVSGDAAALEKLLAGFEAQGLEVRRLTVSHAFHSPLMAPMLEAFRAVAASVSYQAPRLAVFSNLSGALAGAELATADYWVRHVRAPVRFAAGIEALVQAGYTNFIEVGPSATLVSMARQVTDDSKLNFMASLRKDQPAMLGALGQYWAHGGELDWSTLSAAAQRGLRLPAYPFARRSYWNKIDYGQTLDGLHGVQLLDEPLLARRFDTPLLRETLFETVFSKTALPFIDDHRVFGELVVAGAVHLSLLLSAARLTGAAATDGACLLSDVMFPMALTVPEEGERIVQLAIGQQGASLTQFRLMGLAEEGAEPTLHARGNVSAVAAPAAVPDLHAIWQRCGEEVAVDAVYALQRQRHIVVGPTYHWLNALRRGQGETIAKLSVPAVLSPAIQRYSLHPGLIDSCFGALVMAQSMDVDESFIPFAVQALHFYGTPDQPLIAHAVVRQFDTTRLVGDIHLYTEQGQPVAAFIGLEGRRASRSALLAQLAAPALYLPGWQALPAKPMAARPKRWLVLGDGTDLTTELLARLRGDGATVLLAEADAHCRGLYQVNPDHVRLCPDAPEDFKTLRGLCHEVDAVAYLWGISPEADLVTYGQTACAGALHLLQSLADRQGTRVWLLTRGAQAVLQGDLLQAPQQALLWGLGQVAAREHPELQCVCVDLDATRDAAQSAGDFLAAVLQDAREDRLAWRGGVGHAARLQRLPALSSTPALTLDAEATYLITGASGALGRELALWLLAQGARQLALLARSAADAELLALLEQQGARVRYYQVDVADYAALASVFEQIQQQQAPLKGIFHLAGALDDGLISGQNWQRWQQVLAPKAVGAWNLHQLTLMHQVPMFVGFSSVASLLGTAGQGNYAAANAFLDALMQHRRAAGLAGLSVNWGPWSETGMAARLDEAQRARLAAIGVAGLGTHAALEQLGKLLGAGAGPQVGVLAVSWPRYQEAHGAAFLDQLVAPSASPAAGSQAGAHFLRDKLQQAAPAQRKALLTAQLVELVAEVLRLSRNEVAPRERLFDLGVDSLLAVELKNRLQAALGMTLGSTLLFDYPTIESLTDFLLAEFAPVMAAQPVAAVEAAVRVTGEVDDLSEDEAEALLLAQLEQLEGRLP